MATKQTPVLREGTVYFADNGRRICLRCAGQSAKFTGRDISGQRVEAATDADAEFWRSEMGGPLTCERRCTTHGKVAA